MNDMNSVNLIGRLVRDSEISYTAGGYPICKFAIAVNHSRKQGEEWIEEASFFDIALWGKRGEALSTYLSKGKQVGITGELRQDRWEKDGVKRSKVYIECRGIQLLGGKKDGGGSAPHIQQQVDPAARKPGDAPGNQAGFTDDIPF